MPSRHQTFQLIPWNGGINTSQNKALISNNQLVSADNLIFSTNGSRRKREGIDFDWDNASSASASIIGLHDFWYTSAGVKTHVLVGVSDAGVVYSYNVSTGARTTLTVEGTAITTPTRVSFETIANTLVMAFDGTSNVPKSWTGTGNVKDLGKLETSTITTVADVGGSLDGTYFILGDSAGTVAFWIDVDDSGTAEPAHGADRSVEITTITTGMSADNVATQVQTSVDADSEFNASVLTNIVTVTATIAGEQTDIAAGTSGFTVATTLQGQDTPNGSIIRQHLGRLWMNDKTDLDRVHYSTTFDPDDWLGFGDSGAIDIGTGDGDPTGISALFPSFKGDLFIAKRSKLYRITGFDPEIFQITKVSDGIGCEAHNSVAAIDQDDIFFISSRGIHSLGATANFGDFESTFVSSDIQTSFLDDFTKSRLKNSWAVYLNSINSYCLAVSDEDTAAAENMSIWFYNIPLKAWFRWPEISCESMTVVEDSDRRRLYLGTSTTRVAKTFTGTNTDTSEAGASTAIEMKIKTGIIYPDGNPHAQKGFRRFNLLYTPVGTHDILVKIMIDEFTVQSFSISSTTGGGDLLGSTFVLGVSTLASTFELMPYGLSMDGLGRGFQLEIQQTGTDEEVDLQGFSLEYLPAGPKAETTLIAGVAEPI